MKDRIKLDYGFMKESVSHTEYNRRMSLGLLPAIIHTQIKFTKVEKEE